MPNHTEVVLRRLAVKLASDHVTPVHPWKEEPRWCNWTEKEDRSLRRSVLGNQVTTHVTDLLKPCTTFCTHLRPRTVNADLIHASKLFSIAPPEISLASKLHLQSPPPATCLSKCPSALRKLPPSSVKKKKKSGEAKWVMNPFSRCPSPLLSPSFFKVSKCCDRLLIVSADYKDPHQTPLIQE